MEPEEVVNTGIFAKVAAKVNGTDKVDLHINNITDEKSQILAAL